jgi:hypothetical protein
MPPIDSASYLISYLFEIGPTVAAGMGAGPITHEELRAWMDLIGIELQPWEVRFLRRLSRDYLSESHQAEKPDRPAPWQPEDRSQEEREAVARKIRNTMKSLRALAI